MDVNEVLLPRIGLRYEFTSAESRRIGIVARREGDFEVVTYDRKDPDQSRAPPRCSPAPSPPPATTGPAAGNSALAPR